MTELANLKQFKAQALLIAGLHSWYAPCFEYLPARKSVETCKPACNIGNNVGAIVAEIADLSSAGRK